MPGGAGMFAYRASGLLKSAFPVIIQSVAPRTSTADTAAQEGKPVKWVAAAVLLVILLSLGAWQGLRVRTEVAAENAVRKLDDLLGKTEVQRKEIELSMRGLQEGVEGIRKAKIKATVRLDQIAAELEPVEKRMASLVESLKRIREPLAAGTSAEIAGKTYTPGELKEMADKLLEARRECVAKVEGFSKSRATLSGVVASLEEKQRQAEAGLARCRSKLAEIDSQMIALKAMKDASAAMGSADESFSSNLRSLEERLAVMDVEVKAGLGSETEKWDAKKVESQIDGVEAFVKATQPKADTLSELDKVLGGGK